MLRMVNLLMALSLGVHREQLLQRIGLTWPRPFLLRPLFFLCRCEHGQPSGFLSIGCWWVRRWVLEMGILCADEKPQGSEDCCIIAS